MICFMFPGQPLERPSKLPADAEFAAVSLLVRRMTGLDLAGFAPEGGNVLLQLFGTAMSLYRFRCFAAEGARPDIVAEHSMGIYAALAACGAVAEEESIEMTWRVGRALVAAGEGTEYALGCVIGLPEEPLLAVAGNNGVFLANRNTSRHFLIAGAGAKVDAALAESLAAGAFSARRFPADAPLHTPLLAGMEDELREIFAGYRFREPVVPLLDHIDQRLLAAADIPGFLTREIAEPVNWERSYRALKARGGTRFIEVGEGDALGKYNRWIDSEER